MNNKPYNHSTEYMKYAQLDPVNQSLTALQAFQRIEQLEKELEQAKDRIINLEKQKA